MSQQKKLSGFVSRGLSAAMLLIFFCQPAAIAAQDPQVETRTNKKGKIDRWIYRQNGEVVKREYDRNGDGKPDFRVIESHGRLVRKEYDNNFDGKFEKTERPPAPSSNGWTKTTDTENQITP